MSLVGSKITNKNKAGWLSKKFGGYDGNIYYTVEETFKCDVCGETETRKVSCGLYTGNLPWPLFNLMTIEFGYKNNTIHVCKSHKEKEIQAVVDELLQKL